jgi:hypothetical protein
MSFELEEKPEYRKRKVEMGEDTWGKVSLFQEFLSEKHGMEVTTGQAIASIVRVEVEDGLTEVVKDFKDWRKGVEDQETEDEEMSEGENRAEEQEGEDADVEEEGDQGADETGEIEVPVDDGADKEGGERRSRTVER